MNHIVITSYQDFNFILSSAIFIANDTTALNEEIENNMWVMSFSDVFIQSIKIDELELFISQLLQRRSEQLSRRNPSLSAIFYFWFDMQASQLRFNIISSKYDKLPFGCHLTIVHSPESILQEAITDLTAPKEDIIIYDYNFEEDDGTDDEDDDNFTLNVYVERIPLPMQ